VYKTSTNVNVAYLQRCDEILSIFYLYSQLHHIFAEELCTIWHEIWHC